MSDLFDKKGYLVLEPKTDSIDTCLIKIESSRPFSVRDAGAYEFAIKQAMYSDDELYRCIRNVVHFGVFPSASKDPDSGRTSIRGQVEASVAKLLSHSTKAILRRGVLELKVDPENFGQELLFCYLRYVVSRAPKFELPFKPELYFLGDPSFS